MDSLIDFLRILIIPIVICSVFLSGRSHNNDKKKLNNTVKPLSKKEVLKKFIYEPFVDLIEEEKKVILLNCKEEFTSTYRTKKTNQFERFFPAFTFIINNSYKAHNKKKGDKLVFAYLEKSYFDNEKKPEIGDEFISIQNKKNTKRVTSEEITNKNNQANELTAFCSNYYFTEVLNINFKSETDGKIYSTELKSPNLDGYITYIIRYMNFAYKQMSNSMTLWFDDGKASIYRKEFKEGYLKGFKQLVSKRIEEIADGVNIDLDDPYLNSEDLFNGLDENKINEDGFDDLKFKVEKTLVETHSGDKIEAVCVKAIGMFDCFDYKKLEKANFKTDYVVYARDITNPSQPIYLKSVADGFSDQEGLLCSRSDDIETYSYDYGFKNWSNLFLFYPIHVVPPYYGERKIEFVVYFVKPKTKFKGGKPSKASIIYEGSAIYELNYSQAGFLEAGKYDELIDQRIAESAFAMANADGNIEQSEVNLIQNHFEKKNSWDLLSKYFANDYEEDSEDETKKKAKYSQMLRNSFLQSIDKRLSLSDITRDLREKSTIAQQYEVIDLLLSVASSDKKLNPEENNILNKFVKTLGIDAAAYKRMKDKILLEIEDSTHESLGPETFNLTEDMSKDEKCKILRKEYTKWNGQTNNSNPKIKNKAKKLVELAASLRKEYGC